MKTTIYLTCCCLCVATLLAAYCHSGDSNQSVHIGYEIAQTSAVYDANTNAPQFTPVVFTNLATQDDCLNCHSQEDIDSLILDPDGDGWYPFPPDSYDDSPPTDPNDGWYPFPPDSYDDWG